MRKPRIAVSRGARPADAYAERLYEAGGDPVQVGPGEGIPAFDALCLTGGPDVHWARYGQPRGGSEEPDQPRDVLELDDLLPRAWSEGRPILAICRGIQVLNVFRGGTLVQDIGEAHRAKGDEVKPHAVRVDPASRLGAIAGASLAVNSRHHQVIDRVGGGLRPVAWAGPYVEAVEAASDLWVVGVQWHPERTVEVEPAAVDLFGAFARAAEGVPAR